MTDAQKLLALAERMGYKALLGCDAFDESEGHNNPDGVYLCLPDGLQRFDPPNNSEQAIEVWCWLARDCHTSDEGGTIFMLATYGVGFFYSTPAEWRVAVLNAALRVISESARSPQ